MNDWRYHRQAQRDYLMVEEEEVGGAQLEGSHPGNLREKGKEWASEVERAEGVDCVWPNLVKRKASRRRPLPPPVSRW